MPTLHENLEPPCPHAARDGTGADHRAARAAVASGCPAASVQVRLLTQEEVAEVIFEMRIGEAVAAARAAAVEEVLGDSLEARLEGPGEALEDREVDLVVRQETPELLASRRVEAGRRTGS